jgi:hypothetical protein
MRLPLFKGFASAIAVVFGLAASASLADALKVGDLVVQQEDSSLKGIILEVKEGKAHLRFQHEEDHPPAWVPLESLSPMDDDQRTSWAQYEEYRKEREERLARQQAVEKNRETREKLEKQPSNLVYALSEGGRYFRGVRGEKKGSQTLIYWEDYDEPSWVENRNIRPRKNHGLKKSQIGDLPPSPAELARERKAKQLRAQEAMVKCPRFTNAADCLRQMIPCGWNGADSVCEYNGR